MNKQHLIVMIASLAAIGQPSMSRAGENTVILKTPSRNWQMRVQPAPIPALPTRKTATPLDAAALKSSIDQRMQVLFDQAADPLTHLVTAESARKAGVGILADQFADIDRDHDGKLTSTEVADFFDSQLPIAKAASSNEIQIIK